MDRKVNNAHEGHSVCNPPRPCFDFNESWVCEVAQGSVPAKSHHSLVCLWFFIFYDWQEHRTRVVKHGAHSSQLKFPLYQCQFSLHFSRTCFSAGQDKTGRSEVIPFLHEKKEMVLEQLLLVWPHFRKAHSWLAYLCHLSFLTLFRILQLLPIVWSFYLSTCLPFLESSFIQIFSLSCHASENSGILAFQRMTFKIVRNYCALPCTSDFLPWSQSLMDDCRDSYFPSWNKVVGWFAVLSVHMCCYR